MELQHLSTHETSSVLGLDAVIIRANTATCPQGAVSHGGDTHQRSSMSQALGDCSEVRKKHAMVQD